MTRFRLITMLLLVTSLATGCGGGFVTSGRPASVSDSGNRLTISIGNPVGLALASPTFSLIPSKGVVNVTCYGVAADYDVKATTYNATTWTFETTVQNGCGVAVLKSVSFKRADYLSDGDRTITEGAGPVDDSLGGATYELVGSALSVEFWNAESELDQALTVDHQPGRFTSHSFTWDAVNNCTIAAGTLTFSSVADEITVTLNHPAATPATLSLVGDGVLDGSSAVSGTSAVYIISFHALATPGDYTSTLEATWNAGASHCGGVLTFHLDHISF